MACSSTDTELSTLNQALLPNNDALLQAAPQTAPVSSELQCLQSTCTDLLNVHFQEPIVREQLKAQLEKFYQFAEQVTRFPDTYQSTFDVFGDMTEQLIALDQLLSSDKIPNSIKKSAILLLPVNEAKAADKLFATHLSLTLLRQANSGTDDMYIQTVRQCAVKYCQKHQLPEIAEQLVQAVTSQSKSKHTATDHSAATDQSHCQAITEAHLVAFYCELYTATYSQLSISPKKTPLHIHYLRASHDIQPIETRDLISYVVLRRGERPENITLRHLSHIDLDALHPVVCHMLCENAFKSSSIDDMLCFVSSCPTPATRSVQQNELLSRCVNQLQTNDSSTNSQISVWIENCHQSELLDNIYAHLLPRRQAKCLLQLSKLNKLKLNDKRLFSPEVITHLSRQFINDNLSKEGGYSALSTACIANHAKVVTKLLQVSALRKSEDQFHYCGNVSGHTPFHKACISGSIDAINAYCDFSLSLEHPLQLRINTRQGESVFMLAIASGNLNTLKCLLNQFEVNIKTYRNFPSVELTLAQYACKYQQVHILSYLLSLPFSNVRELENSEKYYELEQWVKHTPMICSSRPVIKCIQTQQQMTPEMLLTNFDRNTLYDIGLHERKQLLIFAIQHGFVQAAITIFKTFPLTEAAITSAIFYACTYSQPDILTELLKEKPKILSIRSDAEENLLQIALRRNTDKAREIRQALISYCPKLLEAKIAKHNTLLHFAVAIGNTEAVEYLLTNAKLDISKTNDDGQSVLHAAVEKGNLAMLNVVLKHCQPKDLLVKTQSSFSFQRKTALQLSKKREIHARLKEFQQLTSTITPTSTASFVQDDNEMLVIDLAAAQV
ncbi:MAG: ankyrin repeat domain-containing protein [Parashewanella sp.]